MLQGAKTGSRCNNGAALGGEEKGGVRKVREAIASRASSLLEGDVRLVTEYSIILGKDANVRVVNLSKVVMKSGKDDFLRKIREIKEKISLLEEEANRAKTKLLRDWYDHPTIGTDA
jgi:hypothetical protein